MTRRSWLASLLTAAGLGALIRPSPQPWGDCEVGDIITVGDDPQRYVVTDVSPESVWLRAADYKWVGKRMPTFGAGRTVGVWSTTTRRYQRLRHHWGHGV